LLFVYLALDPPSFSQKKKQLLFKMLIKAINLSHCHNKTVIGAGLGARIILLVTKIYSFSWEYLGGLFV
jgi:hypothetical protein